MLFDNNTLIFGRFCKFCLVEVVPEIIVMIVLGCIVDFLGTISVILYIGAFIFGTVVVCYWTLKWIDYTCKNDKIQNWIKR